MRAWLPTLPLVAMLTACNMAPNKSDTSDGTQAERPAAPAPDPLAAHDPRPGEPLPPAQADDRPRPVMQMQVVLDRLGFTPGVIDGAEGLSTRNAIAGFQEAHDLDVTGKIDDATLAALRPWANIPATRVVTIPADFAAGPFAPTPPKPEDQAKLPALAYQSLDEKLAERFHTTVAVLRTLNPQPGARPAPPLPPGVSEDARSTFRAGQQIRVPNVGHDRTDAARVNDAAWLGTLRMLGVSTDQPEADKIVVSKSKGTLKAFDKQGKLVAMYTATMGSRHDPLPLGEWKVNGLARNPDFVYNPKLFWDVSDDKQKLHLPPGPNGPVGVAWIDLSKEHYGIHGTPEPATIGRAESHGCVRLTNWDVARLAQMVHPGTQVLFEA
ncbi:L,D-transpeptidase family protein [Novosphingobium colocasiae]|uniref:Peptidoglycan-binding protein n=1 Tax=Novosphingobium colocasiae TaxID=1256513 RepID=A0A918UIC5_9SPHN|nr:L,D-transpeptidase family protein [Novosphingobium colocasiae]GGZ12114.1 peptidoglycan-binding protein [Novosphingobium colocasiae]